MSRRSAFVRGPGGVTRRASAKKGRRALLRRESLTAPEVDEAVDDDDSEKYRKTVLLPSTEFSQRANAVKKEPELQKWWDEQRVYERIWERATGPTFTLHDGPPYANGDLHIGHALNKVLKDFINRYRMLRGNKVRYVPGWDCHGLPIELKVVQGLQAEEKKKKKKKKKEKDEGGSPPPPSKALDPLELREKAASFALETVEKQKAAFKRYGVWADWDRPYLTLAPEYEAAQLRVFANMFERGHIYRGRKPVWYSPSSRTALAEAELEYPDGHTSPSVYASFDVVEAAPCAAEYAKNLKLAIWTTTPWTLPANLAVAVGGELEYAVVERTEREERLVVASELVETLSAKFGEELRRLATFTGEELSRGTTYARPVKNEGGEVGRVVVGGDYITAEGGTGLVHTAPGHGLDDFVTGNKYGLDAFSPVDAAGAFTSEAGEGLAGLSVLGEGGKEVASRLEASGHVLLAEPYAHRYPYDWRTKKPVIMRATDQWFASVESFKEAALAAIDEVAWTPSVGKNRISAMTSGRGDWCISRQRAWGVPIPVFYRKSNGEALVTSETIARVEAIVKEKGTDAWWSLEVGELLPPSMRDVADQYIKGTDTMDVWFDSGTSWAGVVASRDELGALPADLYLEGSDQHRGWFQSSLLTSVAVNGGKAPYKAVLTHGFVLDEKGFKMSKSSGNVVDPREVIEGGKDKKAQPPYGADVLRLWVAGVDYAADVRVGANALKQVFEQYRKLRNTFRYLVGNVFDLDEKPDLAYDALPSLDKWILGRLGALEIEAFEAYESYNFARVVNAATRFCVVDLSALYLDVSKDRLYVSPANAKRRRDCQATIAACLSALPRILGPLLPHLAEDLWQAIPYLDGEPLSPDRASVFDLDAPWDIENDDSRLAPFPPHDEARWDVIRALRDDANKALEAARRDGLLGASLDARLFVAPPSENDDRQRAFHAAIAPFLQNAPFQPHSAGWSDVDDLRFLLLVSGVDIVETLEGTPCDPAHVVPSDLSETGATVGVAP
ncbi:hypothetical protein CTAYLR_007108, partial [Chrysophaeum taylorii]